MQTKYPKQRIFSICWFFFTASIICCSSCHCSRWAVMIHHKSTRSKSVNHVMVLGNATTDEEEPSGEMDWFACSKHHILLAETSNNSTSLPEDGSTCNITLWDDDNEGRWRYDDGQWTRLIKQRGMSCKQRDTSCKTRGKLLLMGLLPARDLSLQSWWWELCKHWGSTMVTVWRECQGVSIEYSSVGQCESFVNTIIFQYQ